MHQRHRWPIIDLQQYRQKHIGHLFGSRGADRAISMSNLDDLDQRRDHKLNLNVLNQRDRERALLALRKYKNPPGSKIDPKLVKAMHQVCAHLADSITERLGPFSQQALNTLVHRQALESLILFRDFVRNHQHSLDFCAHDRLWTMALQTHNLHVQDRAQKLVLKIIRSDLLSQKDHQGKTIAQHLERWHQESIANGLSAPLETPIQLFVDMLDAVLNKNRMHQGLAFSCAAAGVQSMQVHVSLADYLKRVTELVFDARTTMPSGHILYLDQNGSDASQVPHHQRRDIGSRVLQGSLMELFGQGDYTLQPVSKPNTDVYGLHKNGLYNTWRRSRGMPLHRRIEVTLGMPTAFTHTFQTGLVEHEIIDGLETYWGVPFTYRLASDLDSSQGWQDLKHKGLLLGQHHVCHWVGIDAEREALLYIDSAIGLGTVQRMPIQDAIRDGYFVIYPAR